MPRTKVPDSASRKEQKGRIEEKLRLYEALYHLNQGFEQVLSQLRLLEEFGFRRKGRETFVEELRAEINFEIVERLQERELRDWAHFGDLRAEYEKRAANPATVSRHREDRRK